MLACAEEHSPAWAGAFTEVVIVASPEEFEIFCLMFRVLDEESPACPTGCVGGTCRAAAPAPSTYAYFELFLCFELGRDLYCRCAVGCGGAPLPLTLSSAEEASRCLAGCGDWREGLCAFGRSAIAGRGSWSLYSLDSTTDGGNWKTGGLTADCFYIRLLRL